MVRNVTVAALAVCLMWPAVGNTQASAAPRARPRVRVETRDGAGGFYTFTDKRGRIGVIVDTKADASGDRVGARVEGITPGGPAEKAGLKAGDVITRFNDTSLAGATAERDEDSGPGMKLIELARRLEPGDTVRVEYKRGSDSRKATIVAEDLGGAMAWTGSMEMPDMGPLLGAMPKMQMGPGSEFEFSWGSPWGGIEMVKLNPDLGDYFGTREGVLVVKAPEDSSLALRGGDVIVSIGSRKPSSPEQAMRILRSYDTGETVTLDVLRKQKHVTVSWKVPEEGHFMRRPAMREEPSWFRVTPPMMVRPRVQIPLMRIRENMRTSRAI